jgi:putative membrane protein
MTRLHPVIRSIADASRGALIGFAEIVPGVSGGTIALLVGVYDTLIDGAGHLARGAARTIVDGIRGRGLSRAAAHFRSVRWNVVLPIGIGMLVAIVVGAALLAPLLEAYPTGTRAVSAGLIAASLIVPARMVGRRWTIREIIVGLLAAGVAVALTSVPRGGDVEPSLIIVSFAAALAVCALILPGVSGSYLLLILGMYAPTLAAVNDRNFAYLGAFIVGAIVGLGLFVSGLQWLLYNRRRVTLVIMTGLMLGSLRALWPWQTESGEVLAPEGNLGLVLLLIAIGAAVVLGILAAEAALIKRRMLSPEIIADPEPHDPEPDAPASKSSGQSGAGSVDAPE